MEYKRIDKFWKTYFDAVVAKHSNLEEDLSTITHNAKHNMNYRLNLLK